MKPRDLSALPASLEERLAGRLRAAGAIYATLFGSLASGRQRPDSDIDVAVSFGKPMTSARRMATIELVADVAGRSVDLIDLEKSGVLILKQALDGVEILCDSVATRTRMAVRLQRTEDERRSIARAARHARKGLFT